MNKYPLIFLFVSLMTFTGCASKFAPVVSRPDNLIIECTTGCKFNIPMNTEIMVARNTNGYDMGKELIRQIPFIGALALSWKSMDVAENLGEMAIDSFNRGSAQAAPSPTGDVYNDNSVATSNVTGDTISTVDSSDSGNSSSADVSSAVDSSGSGNSADITTTTTYTDSLNTNNSNQGNPSTVTYPVQ